MSQITNVLNAAKSQIGYHEKATNAQLDDFYANAGSNNWTKYGAWYGINGGGPNGAAWCAMFVSWCADRAGVGSIIGKGACVYQLSDYMMAHGAKELALHNAPQAGDITTNMWAGNTDGLPDHVGIVESYDPSSKVITVIEGNASDQVKRVTYDYNDRKTGRVYRIYRPAYTDTNEQPTPSKPANSLPTIPDEKDRVKLFQEACIADSLPLNVYGADGVWGLETAKAASESVQVGSVGNRVKLIQTLLIGDCQKYGADGHFGAETHAAVRKYQSKYGFAVDGVVGLNTWRALLGVK